MVYKKFCGIVCAVIAVFCNGTMAAPLKIKDYQFKTFETSMYGSREFKKRYQKVIKNSPAEAQFIKDVATTYHQVLYNSDNLLQTSPIIPKIIHQIWLGSKPLPKSYQRFLRTWLKNHLDWVYKLWRDQDVEELQLINKKYFDSTPSWAEKANLARYEILYRFGGVYVDTDCECLKPFDVLHHLCDFYAGLEFAWKNYNAFIVGNAVIGSRAQHPILKALIENIQSSWPIAQPWTRIHQLERSGTRYFTRTIKSLLNNVDGTTLLMPANVFYPHSGKKFAKLPESMSVHYWDNAWLKSLIDPTGYDGDDESDKEEVKLIP